MNPSDEEYPSIAYLQSKLSSISNKLDKLLATLSPQEVSTPASVEEVYLDVPEVAQLCKVAQRTIYSWVRKGLLEAHRSTGRLLFKQSEVYAFLQDRHRRGGKLASSKKTLSADEQATLQEEVYQAERAYQIAHAYEINRPYNSHYHTCLIVKSRFHITSQELKRCCLLHDTWHPNSY